MRLQTKIGELNLVQPVVMGVLNVTPDSFSDGGRYTETRKAVDRALQMVEEGAAIIDIGGESTRPGAQPVAEQAELDRVIPVIEALRSRTDATISIDTVKPGVMRAACVAGADMINDVRALQEPGALAAAAETGAAVCLMHMQGRPRNMQENPRYGDAVSEIRDFLRRRLHACEEAGIVRERIVLDPGFGFGKTLAHNLQLLGRLGEFLELARPVVVGVSRKSMFAKLLGDLAPEERIPASLSAAAIAVWQGAKIVRAHDVAATRHALEIAAAARSATEDG